MKVRAGVHQPGRGGSGYDSLRWGAHDFRRGIAHDGCRRRQWDRVARLTGRRVEEAALALDDLPADQQADLTVLYFLEFDLVLGEDLHHERYGLEV